MKTITLPAHNRPEYLQRTLQSLSQCYNLADYMLIIGCEPVNEQCIEIASSFSFPNKTIIVNKEKKGVRKNPFELLQTAFHEFNTTVNFHVEEDVEFSSDCLNLTNWFSQQDAKYGLLTFFNRNNNIDRNFEQINEYQIGEGQHNFTPFIWSIKPERWEEIERTNAWWEHPAGWDYSIVDYIKTAHWTNLIVECTRANHIGEHGTYMDSVLFKECYAWRNYAKFVPNDLQYKI